MTEEEFIEALNEKDELILHQQVVNHKLIKEMAQLREELLEQNYYIQKLEAKLMSEGKW